MLDSNSSPPDAVGDGNSPTAIEEALSDPKQGLIDLLIRQELSERNKDVYDKVHIATDPPTGTPPSCIYFYYVRINNSGTVSVDHYFYDRGAPIPYAEMADEKGILKTLALNARPRTPVKDPPRTGRAFKDVQWDRRSYVAMFFDERNWAFHRRRGRRPSVAFNVSEGQTPNESFFDAKDLLIEMPIKRSDRTDKRSAIFFINHYLDSATGMEFAPGVVKQLAYKFDMYLLANYANRGGPAMTVIFDPTGTNTSP
ncbi:MAG TPA: hypothetical protein VFP12_05060 [Allosphingosinicella sp.]|nr:hypothetical protein [Allosphingosinicella sp.]